MLDEKGNEKEADVRHIEATLFSEPVLGLV